MKCNFLVSGFPSILVPSLKLRLHYGFKQHREWNIKPLWSRGGSLISAFNMWNIPAEFAFPQLARGSEVYISKVSPNLGPHPYMSSDLL